VVFACCFESFFLVAFELNKYFGGAVFTNAELFLWRSRSLLGGEPFLGGDVLITLDPWRWCQLPVHLCWHRLLLLLRIFVMDECAFCCCELVSWWSVLVGSSQSHAAPACCSGSNDRARARANVGEAFTRRAQAQVTSGGMEGGRSWRRMCEMHDCGGVGERIVRKGAEVMVMSEVPGRVVSEVSGKVQKL
jgi:hypothetical protein